MIDSKLIGLIRDNLTKPSIERELLEKTSVLKSALLARLKSQFLPSATATVATDSGITLTHVKTEGVIPPSLLKIQEVDYFFNQLKIQPIDTQPLITSQNGNCKDSSQLEKINELSFFDSFNCVDKVAVTGNNQILSKSTSVPPLRHCGFFAPVIYSASQAIKCNAKMTTAHLRPKSVYDWMTRPNKPMANKSGGSSRPRVNPVALISQFSVTSHNSKLLGI
ncbi:MAG: hypothetical protein U1E99_00710 [Agitococcus sp.]